MLSVANKSWYTVYQLINSCECEFMAHAKDSFLVYSNIGIKKLIETSHNSFLDL